MAEVITSIGTDTSITTGTPSSCSGSSSPYTVAFPSTPSGVSIGDSVSFTDEITTYATFTYLVTDISGSSLTLKFLTESSGYTGDTSPCDIQKYDDSYNPVQRQGHSSERIRRSRLGKLTSTTLRFTQAVIVRQAIATRIPTLTKAGQSTVLAVSDCRL